MAQPYIGEIRLFAGTFAPVGWAFCDGSLLPISENDALFTLIGTTYGGDGESTFALPDLRGRVPIHRGTNPGNGVTYALAQAGGAEEVTLTSQQIPLHGHPLVGSTGPAVLGPADAVLALANSAQTGVRAYNNTGVAPNQSLVPTTLQPVGGSQPHTNLQPYLTLSFIISLFGLFPQPT